MSLHRLLLSAAIVLAMNTVASQSASAAPADYSALGTVVAASTTDGGDGDDEPEAYATVRVYAAADTLKVLRVVAADDLGHFAVDLPSAGSYRFSIHSVGKADHDGAFTLTPSAPIADLGVIRLADNANLLGEVNVLAQRPLVTKEIDRVAYDVSADDEASTSTLREILKKVPMVTVESDGTVKVRGSSDFKIYKNGRPNNAFTNNAKDIFAAIPASSIKKIEVITDPGAREDAEGVAAILNIVTDHAAPSRGVTGTVGFSMKARNPVPNPNAYLTAQLGKLTFSLSGGLFSLNTCESRDSRSSESYFYDTRNSLTTLGRSRSNHTATWGSLEASYEPDSLNLFTVELGSWTWGGNTVLDEQTRMTDDLSATIYSYSSHSHYPRSRYLDLSLAANYQHTFAHRPGTTLTLSYQLQSTNQRQRRETDYLDMVNFPQPYTALRSDFDLDFNEHTLQLDWAHPFAEHHHVDVGGKYVYRLNRSTNDRDYVGYQSLSDRFRHLTQIAAAFVDYRLTLGRWSARAGLRYEFSDLSARFLNTDRPSFGSRLNDWVPNAALSWNPTDASSWKVSYNRRIARPGINYLDPSVVVSPTSWSAGNPDLQSAVFNQFELNYMLMRQRFNLNLTAGFSYSDNMMSTAQWTDGTITYSTYANAYRLRRASLSAYMQWTISEKTSLRLNGNYFALWSSMPALGGRVHSRRPANGNVMCQFTQHLPWKLQFNAAVVFFSMSPDDAYSHTSTSASNLFHAVSLQRSFLKDDRLSVRLQADNPFGPYRRSFTRTTTFPGYTSSITQTIDTQTNASLQLTYRFGSLRAAVKRTAASISNDDLEGRKR